MDDDFNTGGALGELYELVRVLNRFADTAKLESTDRIENDLLSWVEGFQRLKELTQILGLFRRPSVKPKAEDNGLTSSLLDLLVQIRTPVRKEKNFQLADEIRNRFVGLGVVLEDRPDGTTWKIERG